MCIVLSTRTYHNDIMSQAKPVLNVTPYLLQIHFNNKIQSTPTAPKWSFPFGFLTKLILLMSSTCSITLNFIHKMLGKKHT